MSKFLRKIFPLLVFYEAAGLVNIGLHFVADAFGIDTNGALFFFLMWVFGALCVCGIFWNLGCLIQTRLPTLSRFLRILSVGGYFLGLVMTFINIFYPIFGTMP